MEPATAAPPPAPVTASTPGKPVRRQPLIAVLLSFVAPGLGHLYVGKAGTAFGLGLLGVLASPIWILIWSKARFSGPAFLWGFLLIPLLLRFGAALASALHARKQEPMSLMKWQRPLAYGTFFMLFFMTSATADNFVAERFATRLSVPTDGQAPTIQQGDGVWLVRTGASHIPRKGAVVVFKRIAAQQSSAVFIHQGAPVIGRVVAMGGDEVEVTTDAVTVNGEVQPNSAGGAPAEKVKLREGQVFVLASNRSATAPDCRDLGPLPIRDYAGEIALVQSKGKSPVDSINTAQGGLLQ